MQISLGGVGILSGGGGAKYFGGPPENLSIAMAPCIIHPIIIHTPPKGNGHILDGHILDGKKMSSPPPLPVRKINAICQCIVKHHFSCFTIVTS